MEQMENKPIVYPNIRKIDENANMPSRFTQHFPLQGRRVYTDLRSYADDKTVLRNPHKGWFWHYIDNSCLRPQYRQEHDPNDHLEDFPGLNHLYLRFDWGDIEKEEGNLDWSYIDQIMEKWGKLGYRFSMRICTYEGNPKIPFSTPEYVYKAGARGYMLSDGRIEPDYGDPIYLEKLGAFMELAGKKFNGDPRLELIDVGTFGTWGEGHTFRGSNRVYSAEVLRTHIDLHVKNFPNTVILLNDDHINHGWDRGEKENFELLDYARSLGLGLQDDSICVHSCSLDFGYDTLRTPWMFDLFWENAPILLEFEHYDHVAPEIFKSGIPFLDAMMRTHATFAGFHGYPRPWLTREPYLTAYCANRLGYWYFVNGVEASMIKANVPNTIYLWVENRGFGLCYRNYALRLVLKGADGSLHAETLNAGNKDWKPGQEVRVPYSFNPKNLHAGEYGLYIGLCEGETPVLLGIDPHRKENDLYYLCNVTVVE
jgi:hypothetical protein